MQNALVFILRTLFDLYILTFAIRLLLQWAAVDKRNPLVQFILRVTNPLVIPLRRLLPSIGRIDTATVVALVGLQVLATALVVRIGCIGEPEILPVLSLAILNLARLALSIFTWSIIIHVVLSWVSPGGYNPAAALIAAIVEPLLAPFRRLIPAVAGLDLSPLFALIAIQALSMLLPVERVLSGLLCSSLGRSVF
ncbi:MAG: YggT family protein [Gammaproteobacteria bacterium]|nr:YggT family protein [Gammaproteobacteria bacterium]